MYQVRGDQSRLEKTELACPDTFYWPGYIWFWNDRITRENISEQLEVMRASGAMCVWVLPFPNFRPDFNPSAMEPEYLSDEFMDLYRYCVEKSAELGMRVWLYDEGGWPSGSAGGRVIKERPDLAEQVLWMEKTRHAEGDIVEVREDCLSAFLYRGEQRVRTLSPGENVRIDFPDARMETYGVFRNPAYPDPLKPESAREFIRHTHEAYRRLIGNYFGNVIPLVFADEPRALNPPWTDDLEADFAAWKGYDIKAHLPAIIKADQDEGAEVRVDFYDWWTDRYASAFFRQIREWCQENDLFFSGHLGGEDHTLGPREHGFGHPMRILREMDIPGVDAIWRQVFPGRPQVMDYEWGQTETCKNHYFPKYASSVIHQDGKRWAMTESFAVYGSGLTPTQMKWITDFQYVRGINLETMGGTVLSTRDFFMGSQRPLFLRANPLQDCMHKYHEYVARLSYLLSLGEPVVETALYYPVRDIWAGGIAVRKIADSHDRLAAALLERQCDFDLIDDDALERESTRVEDGRLVVGPMRYHTVFVSRCNYMTEASKARLAEFSAAGGKLFWVDVPIDGLKPEFGECIDAARIDETAYPMVRVRPALETIRVCKRQLSNGNLYFITNEDLESVSCVLDFDESRPVVRIDPETGDILAVPSSTPTLSGWSVPVDLPFGGSWVLFFTDEELAFSPEPAGPGEVVRRLESGWLCRKATSYRVGERDFEVEELPDEKLGPISLGDWQSTLGDDFSGKVEYVCRFTCSREEAETVATLDLGTVNYVCEVTLNGSNLGKRIWEPFSFPVEGLVVEGENELTVSVVNTMANQYVTTKNLDKWPENVVGPYHKISLEFEKESVSSGLFGPVTLMSRAQR